MKGYRTIIANILMAVVSIAAIWGIDIPAEAQQQIVTGIVAVIGVVNLILRSVTTTPIGRKE